MMRDIVANADRIAERAHASIDQRRKWGNEHLPYIVHPRRCAKKAKDHGLSEIAQAVMLLHDVIEDVAIKQNLVDEYEDEIRNECGQEVLDGVWELTSPSEGLGWENKSRAEKRAADWEHLSHVSDKAKRLKMIDRLDNLSDYKSAPAKYMVQKYLPESRHLLGMCRYTDEKLGKELENQIEEAERYFSARRR